MERDLVVKNHERRRGVSDKMKLSPALLRESGKLRLILLESKQALSEEELCKMHAYWRAANCLSVGQIYLYETHGCGNSLNSRG